MDRDLELRYVGEAGGIEEGLAARAGIPFVGVATGQVRGRAPWVMARNTARMVQGARQCAALLRGYRPDVILVTGGYVTVPLAIAARSRPAGRRVPLLIYLPDLTPGLAVRWTSRLATRVAVSFPEVTRHFPGKAIVTGYPVRPELLAADKTAARAALGVGHAGEGLPLVLVFGGSRGARSINRALVDALPQALPRCEVLHVSGQLDWSWVAEAAAKLPAGLRERYHPFPYLHDEMVDALAAADVAVARAGASTLGEFPARGLPSILAPYPYAGQHQQANAEYLARRGAALIVQDEELPSRLAQALLDLIADPARLEKMGRAAAGLARPEAAFDLARLLYQLAGR